MKKEMIFLVVLMIISLIGCADTKSIKEDNSSIQESVEQKTEEELESPNSNEDSEEQETSDSEEQIPDAPMNNQPNISDSESNVEEEDIEPEMNESSKEAEELSNEPEEETKDYEEKKEEEEGEEENNVLVEALAIQEMSLDNTYEKDGIEVADVHISYPVIENPNLLAGIDEINLYFEENAQALYDECDVYATDIVDMYTEELDTENSDVDLFHSYELTFEVTYNANGLLSVVQKYLESSTDMPRPNSYHTGYVFQVLEGTQLEIGDILLGSDEEVSKQIGQAFLSTDEMSEDTIESLESEILNNTDYADFYLEHENLCLFYDAYLIAPYTTGVMKATIPLDEPDIYKIEIPIIESE